MYQPEKDGPAIVLSTPGYLNLSAKGTRIPDKGAMLKYMKPYHILATYGARHATFEKYTFDELSELAKSCRHLVPITDPEELKRHGNVGYQCSCAEYWHFGKCKHSMALAIRKGGLTIPAIYNNTIVGKKRGAGRPSGAKAQKRHK